MTVLTLTITDAGRNAMVNAANTGTLPLALDKVVLGRACYVPTATQLALHDPIKPLATFGGSLVADDTIHITITDDSFDTYLLGEIGLYSGEVLFAVYSQALPILEKGPEQMVLLSADIQFLSLPANSVTVGSTEFSYPQGNELRPGVLEIATPDEATTGKDHTRAITPLTLKQGLETKLGKLETAVAAVKLLSQRLLKITGNAVGQVGFDGSSDVEMNLTITPKMIGAVAKAAATNWATADVIDAVVGLLSWRNYGNGHTIFDASAGLSPGGTLVDKTNAQIAWSGTFPTLMGWNGATTYGVRVDSARQADLAGYSTYLDGGTIKTKGQDLTFWDKRAMVGNDSANQLIINYGGDWGSTLIQGHTYLQTVESNRHVVVHNGATSYQNSGLELRATDGSDVRLGMHRSGQSAGAIVHNSWGFTFEREAAGSNANVGAGNFFANDTQSGLGNALTRLDYVGANFLKYRHRLMTDDGTSIDNVSREYGFNYQTGGGVFGPYISFGGMSGSYDCQINADYGTGNEIRFRTRNGDAQKWNTWHSFWHAGNFDPATKLNTLGGTVTGTIYNSLTGVPNTFVGGKISSEAGTLSIDGYTYAFVTSPMDAHLCFNSYYQPSVGWKKYDNARPSGKVVVNGANGLQYVRSDAGSSAPNQYSYDIWHGGNFNPDSKLSENGTYGGSLRLGNWFRSYGASGWFNETYGGGIYQDEATSVKVYGGKKFYVANAEYNAIAATGGIFSYRGMSVDTRATVGNGGSFQAYRYSDAPFHAGHGGLDVNSFAPIVGSANYTNGQGYTTRIQLGALTPGGTGWSSAALMVGSAENNAHPLATFIFSADGSMSGITGISLTGNITIGNDMICSYAYANGAQPLVATALTRKDYVDAQDYAVRWGNHLVPNHTGGDANAHYNSEWDGSGVANAPSSEWHFFRELYHSGGANWRHQEAFNFYSDEEWFRRGLNAADYGPWRRRWHSGNFDPASKSDMGHGHAISVVDGLQNALDSKAPNGHTHWRLAANGACSIAMANHATGTYRATIDTGVAPAHNFVHDANKYRVVLFTNNINTSNAAACTWGAYGVVRALSKWNGGSSMQIDVYSYGNVMNSGTIYSWELWEAL
jgi:hypothetical protein